MLFITYFKTLHTGLTIFEMIQWRWHVPGTAILVAVRRAKRGGLFFVRVELWYATAVVIVQPRLETRCIAATARLLRPKVKVLFVEVTVIVPNDYHVVGFEEHIQTLVELHASLVLARLGRLGTAAAGRCALQRGLFRPGLAAVALLLLFVGCYGGRRFVFLLLLFHVGSYGQAAFVTMGNMAKSATWLAQVSPSPPSPPSPPPPPPSSSSSFSPSSRSLSASLPCHGHPNDSGTVAAVRRGEAATAITVKTTLDFPHIQRAWPRSAHGNLGGVAAVSTMACTTSITVQELCLLWRYDEPYIGALTLLCRSVIRAAQRVAAYANASDRRFVGERRGSGGESDGVQVDNAEHTRYGRRDAAVATASSLIVACGL